MTLFSIMPVLDDITITFINIINNLNQLRIISNHNQVYSIFRCDTLHRVKMFCKTKRKNVCFCNIRIIAGPATRGI